MDSTEEPLEAAAEFLIELKKQAASVQHGDNEGQSRKDYVDADGTVFEWDAQRQGWFPKVDEDFLAAYQLSYGVSTSQEQDEAVHKAGTEPTVQPTSSKIEDENLVDDEGAAQKKKRKSNDVGWFEMESERNTNIYVSGLPLDVKEEDFVELMSKFGIIMDDLDTKKPKVKLYRDKGGQLKGDGICCYLKVESVALAIQMLDDTKYKGNQIHVQQAEFQLKGEYNPALKKKKKKNKKKKKQAGQAKLLDWVDRDVKRPKCERILIFKNMFDITDFEKKPALITELRDDLKTECERFGEVKKVMVFDRNNEGVCSVAFKEFESAEACVPVMNGRWFAEKQISVANWDGQTNYKVEETEEQRDERLKKWGAFLFDEMDEEEPTTSASSS